MFNRKKFKELEDRIESLEKIDALKTNLLVLGLEKNIVGKCYIETIKEESLEYSPSNIKVIYNYYYRIKSIQVYRNGISISVEVYYTKKLYTMADVFLQEYKHDLYNGGINYIPKIQITEEEFVSNMPNKTN